LDPRIKDWHLQDKEITIIGIKEESLQYYWSVLAEDSTGEVISCDKPDPPTKKRMKGLAAVIQHVIDEDTPAATLMLLQKIEKEISTYLEYPPLKADADPLERMDNFQT